MAKGQKRATATGGLKGFYAILAVVAIVGIVALVSVVAKQGGAAATEPIPLPELTTDTRALVEMAKGVTIGESTAPVKLIVFSDYQCPWCGQFSSQVKPLLVENQVKAGKLQLVMYDFPLGGGHKYSFVAARAARCAGDQGKFWEYHDLLFGQQSRWSTKPSVPIKQFEEYAAQLGLDTQAFGQCLNSDRHADVVSANRLLGEQLGVNGTPTVIINNKRVQRPLDYGELSELIEREAGA